MLLTTSSKVVATGPAGVTAQVETGIADRAARPVGVGRALAALAAPVVDLAVLAAREARRGDDLSQMPHSRVLLGLLFVPQPKK